MNIIESAPYRQFLYPSIPSDVDWKYSGKKSWKFQKAKLKLLLTGNYLHCIYIYNIVLYLHLFTEKNLMLGGIGGRRRKGWQRMRWLDGRDFEWTPGVGDGQGGLVCCNSWGHKELDTTERLNWTEQSNYIVFHIISDLEVNESTQ